MVTDIWLAPSCVWMADCKSPIGWRWRSTSNRKSLGYFKNDAAPAPATSLADPPTRARIVDANRCKMGPADPPQ